MESCTALAIEHMTIEDCRKGATAERSDDLSHLEDGGGGVTTPVRLSRDNTRTWSDDDSESSPLKSPDQHLSAAETRQRAEEAAAQAEAEHRVAAMAMLQRKLERERRELFEAISETRRLREALSAAEADRNRLQMLQTRTQAELDASRKTACDLKRELDHEIYRRRFFQALAEELKS